MVEKTIGPECGVCKEQLSKGQSCFYCGFFNATSLENDDKVEEVEKKAQQLHREKILNNISEVGVVLQRYQSVQNKKVVCKEENSPLFLPKGSNNENIRENVFYGKNIILYFKTRKNDLIKLPVELKNLPDYDKETFYSFEISAKINDRLKVDVFYHDKDGNPKKVIVENLKLGTTLAGI